MKSQLNVKLLKPGSANSRDLEFNPDPMATEMMIFVKGGDLMVQSTAYLGGLEGKFVASLLDKTLAVMDLKPYRHFFLEVNLEAVEPEETQFSAFEHAVFRINGKPADITEFMMVITPAKDLMTKGHVSAVVDIDFPEEDFRLFSSPDERLATKADVLQAISDYEQRDEA